MEYALWAAAILAAGLVVLTVVVLVRRRRGEAEEPSAVFPPSSADSGAQVRLLEGDDTARQARVEALQGELRSLRREVAYAEQRGLDRRAERLRSLIDEREDQLQRHDAAEDRAS